MTSDDIVAVDYQQELERLQAQVSELALTLMTRDAEMDELVALVVAWVDACDRWGSEGLDITEQRIEETGRALRKAVGR